eukprot:TRINITY_DN101462_c0_g1_i1.p1 TRINITY_DN101462_c0_g1~~TRINITY_DN101462_c0_g1_i1.p1  ORF type:complete len:477 (+),score=64.63 TRINITY_DN101462_c0_g1_i1:76-1506(+)
MAAPWREDGSACGRTMYHNDAAAACPAYDALQKRHVHRSLSSRSTRSAATSSTRAPTPPRGGVALAANSECSPTPPRPRQKDAVRSASSSVGSCLKAGRPRSALSDPGASDFPGSFEADGSLSPRSKLRALQYTRTRARSPSADGSSSPRSWDDTGIILGPSTTRGQVWVGRAARDSIPREVSTEQLKRFALFDRFHVGDIVESKVKFERQNGEHIRTGDLGTVIGPSSVRSTMMYRLACKFPNMPSVNLTTTQVTRRKLPRGFKVDDIVLRRASAKSSQPMQGFVVGASQRLETHVRCQFDGLQEVDVAVDQVELCRLPGGFRVNDCVESLLSFTRYESGESIEVGDIGTVLGPAVSHRDADGRSKRLTCSFPGMDCVNMDPAQVKLHRLPYGLRVGQPVALQKVRLDTVSPVQQLACKASARQIYKRLMWAGGGQKAAVAKVKLCEQCRLPRLLISEDVPVCSRWQPEICLCSE